MLTIKFAIFSEQSTFNTNWAFAFSMRHQLHYSECDVWCSGWCNMAQLCSSGFAHLHKLNYFNVQIFLLSITCANVQLNALPICTVSHMGCERRLSVCLAYYAQHTVLSPAHCAGAHFNTEEASTYANKQFSARAYYQTNYHKYC